MSPSGAVHRGAPERCPFHRPPNPLTRLSPPLKQRLDRTVQLYDRKTPLTAADLLNDRVIPFYEEHDIPLQRVLTDRGTEYCGTHDRHEYELYLAVENIDHTRTKAKSPQTTDVIDRCLFARSELFLSRARVTARRRAGREAKALPRSLHRRTSFAASVRARLGPRGFQPATKRA
jgi:hypothetical protein